MKIVLLKIEIEDENVNFACSEYDEAIYNENMEGVTHLNTAKLTAYKIYDKNDIIPNI